MTKKKRGNIILLKIHKVKNFSIVDLTNVQDSKLSWKAKGIFLYLTSRPPEWRVWANDLEGKATDGRTSLYHGLKELEDKGYLRRIQGKDEKNRFLEITYHLFERPCTDFPRAGDQTLSKNNNSNYKIDDFPLEFPLGIPSKSSNCGPSDRAHLDEPELPLIRKIENPPPYHNNIRPKLKRRSKIQTLRDNFQLTQSAKEAKAKKLIPVIKHSRSVGSSMDKWLSLGLSQHQPGNKAYNRALSRLQELLDGTLFDKADELFSDYKGRKFAFTHVATAMENFALAALNPDYSPGGESYKQHLKHMSLPVFLYNFRGKDKRHKSLFLHYLENRPEPLSETMYSLDDDWPLVTKTIRDFYITQVLGGLKPKNGFCAADENKFIKAAARTVTYLQEFASQFRVGAERYKKYPGQFAKVVCAALLDHYGEDELRKYGIGCFGSDNTFDKLLPAYLHSQAIIEQGAYEYLYRSG